MLVDVLKRYLLIVWNFFFGQISSDSIQDSPPCSKNQPDDSTNVVSPVEAQNNEDDIENEDEVEVDDDDDDDDDIEEIFDYDVDAEEDEEEETNELDKEDEEAVVVPNKPKDKVIVNDVPTPTKPSQKVEEVKVVPEVPKANDDVKKPDLPKAVDDKDKGTPKADNDKSERTEETPKSTPEFEIVEREGKVAPETTGDSSKSQSEFEIVERESGGEVVVPETKKEVAPKAEPENNKKEVTPKVEPEKKEVAAKVVPESKGDADDAPPRPAPEKKDDEPKADVKVDGAANVVPEKKDDAKPRADDVKLPEKVKPHVKFEVNDDEDDGAKGEGDTGHGPAPPDARVPPPKGAAVDDFVALEKGDGAAKSVAQQPAAGGQPKAAAIDSFLSGEQRFAGQTSHHPESIQDQQLDYSDSGEELSDDDIEIDYEDDEDEDVEEVKPLPPVARSVYKKND